MLRKIIIEYNEADGTLVELELTETEAREIQQTLNDLFGLPWKHMVSDPVKWDPPVPIIHYKPLPVNPLPLTTWYSR